MPPATPLRGAIIGFGAVARHGHWPAYQDVPRQMPESGVPTIVAIVDGSQDRRALARQLNPSVHTFSTFDELTASGLPLDFVDICTPPALHAAPMLGAIERRWHVLCEKPFLLDPDLIDVVRDRARVKGVAVLPVHNWKYAPILEAATRALRSGSIGALRRVRLRTTRLREAASTDPTRPHWRRDPAVAGGGILMDHGWHAVYLALHWFECPPTTVHASLHWPATMAPVEDEASVRIDFLDGRQADIELTWNGTIRSNSVHLIGTAGDIAVDDATLCVRNAAGSFVDTFDQPLSAGSHHADWFARMLPDVSGCFREPARAARLFDEAAICLTVIRQAYLSDAETAAAVR